MGDGWWRGYLGWEGGRDTYGNQLGLLFQLNIQYTDGTTELIVSDDSWKWSTGQITEADLYNGQTIDQTVQASTPKLVAIQTFGFQNLVPTQNETVRAHEEISPKQIFANSKAETIIDFGQNLVGWVRLKYKGNRGDTITLYHAEVLNSDKTLYTENLRKAVARDRYILGDDRDQTFEPKFTFHGFRYIKVEGIDGDLDPKNFTAVTLYSDMKPTGSFTCSDSLINRLQRNIQWSQKGNFLDVPTAARNGMSVWAGQAMPPCL